MDWFPLFLSIKVASIAAVISAILAIPIGRLMARRHFWGKDVLEAIFLLPMVLPPTVVGYALLMTFGKNGFIGGILAEFGINIIFTPTAAIIASAIVAFPLMYMNARTGFSQVDVNLERAACTLGAGRLWTFFTISLPLSFPALVAGVVLSFARALGEFGATMMVAGNIPGRTQTIPLAIYFAMDAGNNEMALKLVIIITIFSFGVILWSNWWLRKYKLRGR